MNYQVLARRGWPIGSGAVESAGRSKTSVSSNAQDSFGRHKVCVASVRWMKPAVIVIGIHSGPQIENSGKMRPIFIMLQYFVCVSALKDQSNLHHYESAPGKTNRPQTAGHDPGFRPKHPAGCSSKGALNVSCVKTGPKRKPFRRQRRNRVYGKETWSMTTPGSIARIVKVCFPTGNPGKAMRTGT